MNRQWIEVRCFCLLIALVGGVRVSGEHFQSQVNQVKADYQRKINSVSQQENAIRASYQRHQDRGRFQREMREVLSVRMKAYNERSQKLGAIARAEGEARRSGTYSTTKYHTRVIATYGKDGSVKKRIEKIPIRSTYTTPRFQSRIVNGKIHVSPRQDKPSSRKSSPRSVSRSETDLLNTVPWRNAVEGGGRISKEWHGFEIPDWVVRFKVVEDTDNQLNGLAYRRKGKFVLITDPQRRGGARVTRHPRPPKPPIPVPSGPVRKASKTKKTGVPKTLPSPTLPVPKAPEPSIERTFLRVQDSIFISTQIEAHYGIESKGGEYLRLTYSRFPEEHKEPLFEFGLAATGTWVRKVGKSILLEVQWLRPYEGNEAPFEKLTTTHEDLDDVLEALASPNAHAPLGWTVYLKEGVVQKIRKTTRRQGARKSDRNTSSRAHAPVT